MKKKAQNQTKESEECRMKKMLKSNKGITLIALVVTIVVLIILATISINAVLGENGMIKRAELAKEIQRGATVQDEVSIWKAEKELGKHTDTTVTKKEELLEDLLLNKLITEEEKTTVEETGKVIIGGILIDFGKEKTLGEVYTDDMIGQKITYTANGQDDWIVFGKDSEGNVLITTEAPIYNGFELNCSVKAWLTIEEDLNTECSGYGGTIQGKTVTARSITLDDINYVAGFAKPTSDAYGTYTFGTIQDYDNKKVNYYYPSLDASENGYWKQPTKENEATFQRDGYRYRYDWNKKEYLYADPDSGFSFISAKDIIGKPENCKYIWGGNSKDTCFDQYLIATQAVIIYDSYVGFDVVRVGQSEVQVGFYEMCGSDGEAGWDLDYVGERGIRPVVVLPSSIEVKESNGIYDIAY